MPEALDRRECRIWWTDTTEEDLPLVDLLTAAERARATRLRHRPARRSFVWARAIAKLAVMHATGQPAGQVVFRATCRHCGGPHGRLMVDDALGTLYVSISHSSSRVAVAITREYPCGVDVEQVALRGDRLPLTALAPTERAVLQRLPRTRRLASFIRYWVRKEALLKATGDGLLVSPARVTVSAPNEAPQLLSWTDRPPPATPLYLSDLAMGSRYHGAVATLGQPMTVRQRPAQVLLTQVLSTRHA